MKALITAAGLGSRLGDLTKDTNKCLLEVGGKPLLRHLVNTLQNLSIDDIYVMTGYCREKVDAYLGDKATSIHNPDYATTGLLVSIQQAKEHLIGSDFLIILGDSLMHPEVIREFLEEEGEVLASVEIKQCDEEDFKAKIVDNKIVAMSKEMPLHEATGEFTAMVRVPARASQAFFDLLEEHIKDGSQKKYVADIVMLLQANGFAVTPVLTNHPRIEIDFPEDLERAQEMYKNFI